MKQTIALLLMTGLIGCSSISPEQMSTVTDPARDGVSTDPLGGSSASGVGSTTPYPPMGGAGI